MKEHKSSCPRAQFWDAGEWEAPCTCGSAKAPPTARELIEAYRLAARVHEDDATWEQYTLDVRARDSFALALELAENVDKFDGTKRHLDHIRDLGRRALAAMDGKESPDAR